MSRAPRTYAELRARITGHGCSIVKGKTHDIVLRPNGTRMMPMPVSASDHRAVLNTWRDFRRNLEAQPAR